MTSKPRTPRKKRKAYSSSETNIKKEIKILKQNQKMEILKLNQEIKILKQNQEIMRKSFNRLNNKLKELEKNLNQKDNKSLPSGMYVG